MNKIATYLQSHISGDVYDGNKITDFYSRDGSILRIEPSMVIYPRTTNDIRKVARFSWQLAEKGHTMPITARGGGSDTTGAAIGSGIILNTIAHMNKILELDTKQRLVRVQPGLNIRSLQETLYTHGLFLPAYPPNYQYATIGGAIANNAAGEKSQKYGSMRQWVDKLEVVLANGEVIQTGKISKKELSKKKGLATLEGEIYRAIDGLITDHKDALKDYDEKHAQLLKDNVGYNLWQCLMRDGSCDLTPLFIGSQGTLGIITEAILKVEMYSPAKDVIAATFSNINQMVSAVDELAPLKPSSLEMIDKQVIEFVKKDRAANPLQDIFDKSVDVPEAVLFIEFDEPNSHKRGRTAKRADKIVSKYATASIYTKDPEQQEVLQTLRGCTQTIINYEKANAAGIPIIDDCVVPPGRLAELFTEIKSLSHRHKIPLPVWGHIGEANLHICPVLDLSKLGDRQRTMKLMDEYFRKIIDMGGSIAGENNDGRTRAPYAVLQLGSELVEAYDDLKKACDPHNILNPGVKSGTTLKQIVQNMRKEFSMTRFADYLPWS